MYNIYKIQLTIRDKICGGMPKNPDLLKGWIAATTEHQDEVTDKQVEEARDALLEPTQEKSWNGFPADDKGLFIWSRSVKALFKECASMLRITTQKIGSKQILQHGFEVKGLVKSDRVYFGKDKPDGFDEGPIHVQTAQGPRSAIKRVDYVTGVTIEFEVWVLHTNHAEKRHLGEEELVEMLRFGQENGLGADRSQGHGKFDVTGFEALQTGHVKTFGEDKKKSEPKGKKKITTDADLERELAAAKDQLTS
jgi:CRISPR/Cas system CSM-associated protein Csm4 (group 5 of RAMP superfamily)